MPAASGRPVNVIAMAGGVPTLSAMGYTSLYMFSQRREPRRPPPLTHVDQCRLPWTPVSPRSHGDHVLCVAVAVALGSGGIWQDLWS